MPGVVSHAGLDLGPDVTAKFDACLTGGGAIGVAVSGGSDSLALLYALHQWGKRPLHVFCVDHGLNPLSSTWTSFVAGHAAALGVRFTALAWQGDKPKTGLSAAARTARHALLADAARAHGIRVLCLAHTADDMAEAARMRAEGSNVGTPAEWSPSPSWPQGRGVFLFRPLLGVRRQTLRDGLRRHGVTWIDDPANSNPASHRARARLAIHDNEVGTPGSEPPTYTSGLFDLHPLGLVRLHAPILATLPHAESLKVVSAAIVCAGGGNKLPRTTELETVLAGLDNSKTMTLCGARVWRDGTQIDIVREPGDIARHGNAALSVRPGSDLMWDGRFSLTSLAAGRVIAASGSRRQLSAADQANVAAQPSRLRSVLPLFEDENGKKELVGHPCLTLKAYKNAHAICWVPYRFIATLGQFHDEGDLARFLQ